jgi:UDP-2,3-diacylglucosamine pyrophosphatase LpxH
LNINGLCLNLTILCSGSLTPAAYTKIMIYFIGDIHGDFDELAHRLAVRKIKDSVLIQVGDFGLGFSARSDEELKMKSLNKILKSKNNVIYAIRGNHDDPEYFEKKTKIGKVCLLPDYSIVKCDGNTVLLAGGAISIDRSVRVQGRNYWSKEKFVFDSNKLVATLAEIQTVDIVVTHSAPKEFWPFAFSALVHNYIKRDDDLAADLSAERKRHSKLLKFIMGRFAPSHWYYGHFHTTNDGKYNNLRYYALGEAEIRQHLWAKI